MIGLWIRALTFGLVASLGSSPILAEERDPAADLHARVDAYLEPLVASRLFSGSVLLARNGKVLLATGYGKAHFGESVTNTPETRFKLMSVSKPFTAIAIMKLHERGKLSIGDPVAKHLRDWPPSWREVTLHHLLSHTSGIANLELEWTGVELEAGDGRGLELWPRLSERIRDQGLSFAPGERTSYSNFNYILLGLVIEAASQRPYADYLRSAVLDPAGMDHTGIDDGSRFPGLAMGYFWGRDGALVESTQDMSMIQAAGGLYSTVRDLFRLDRALDGDQLLARRTRDLMFAPVNQGFAAGWQISRLLGRNSIHHSGGSNGFVADFLRFPDEDAVVVVTSNFAFASAGRISHDLAAILFNEPYRSPVTIAPKLLDAYAGIFATPGRRNRTLLIRRSGRALLLFDLRPSVDRIGAGLLTPVANDVFLLPWGGEELRFVVGEGGLADSVRVELMGRRTVMERLGDPTVAWRSALGTYLTEPQLGAPVNIVEDQGRYEMRVPGNWPLMLELLPVSETEAISLYGETGGTILRLERDDKGLVEGFVWQRPDGVTFRGRRQES